MKSLTFAALTNRQLAYVRAINRARAELDAQAPRALREALEAAAIQQMHLAYRRLLVELAEQAGVTLSGIPGDAADLIRVLREAEAAVGGAEQCQALEASGWLADMLRAAQADASLRPPVAPARTAATTDLIALAPAAEERPLDDWYLSLQRLTAELRETSLEW